MTGINKNQLIFFMIIGGLIAGALIVVPSVMQVYNTSYTFSEFTVIDKSSEFNFYVHMHPESALYLTKQEYDQINIGDTCNVTRAKGQYMSEWRIANAVCGKVLIISPTLIERTDTALIATPTPTPTTTAAQFSWNFSWNRTYSTAVLHYNYTHLDGIDFAFNQTECDKSVENLGRNCTCYICGGWIGYEKEGFYNRSGVYYSDGTPTGMTLKQMEDIEEKQSNIRYRQFMLEHGIVIKGEP